MIETARTAPRKIRRYRAAFIFVAASHLCLAPSAQSVPDYGTVSGYVTLADSGLPARFAELFLFDAPIDPAVETKLAAQSAVFGSHALIELRTGSDGTFSAPHVPPGMYYFAATYPGYLTIGSLLPQALDESETHNTLARIPLVRVKAGETAQVSMALERGASISGRVLWDDGTPVADMDVKAVPVTPVPEAVTRQLQNLPINNRPVQTNDLGQFRITGLPAGEYLLEVTIQTNFGFSEKGDVSDTRNLYDPSTLTVFAPGVFHRATAQRTVLSKNETSNGSRITIDLNDLYTVSGQVVSAVDGHALNTGTILIKDIQDKSFDRSSPVQADGSFLITSVPQGSYDLELELAADSETYMLKDPDGGSFSQSRVLTRYQNFHRVLVLTNGDVTGLNLTANPESGKK